MIFELLFLFVFKEKGAGAPPPVSVSSGTANKYYLLDRPEYKSIVEKNIFCPGCPIPDLASRLAAEPKSCDVAESLSGPVKLVGTIVLSNPKFSVATFSHGAETETLRTGESYKNYGKIFEIRRERVCFEDAEGNILFVSLPNIDQLNIATPSRTKKNTNTRPSRPLPKVEGIAVTEDEIEIKRDFLMKAIADPKTLRDAYATPYRENGEIRGFRINSINPGSVYEAMGFQAGDILSEVDGSALDSIAKAQELFAAITNTNEANVTFLRNGNPVTKTFKVK